MMNIIKKLYLTLTYLGLTIAPNLSVAHLMEPEQGTLNFVDNYVYLALALPISTFDGIDDNQNGNVSGAEFNAHREKIAAKIRESIYLSNKQTKFIIEGLLLNPSVAHTHAHSHGNEQKAEIDQLNIMGRFTLPSNSYKISLNVKLFSNDKNLQRYQMTATNKKKNLKHKFEMRINESSISLFSNQ